MEDKNQEKTGSMLSLSATLEYPKELHSSLQKKELFNNRKTRTLVQGLRKCYVGRSYWCNLVEVTVSLV